MIYTYLHIHKYLKLAYCRWRQLVSLNVATKTVFAYERMSSGLQIITGQHNYMNKRVRSLYNNAGQIHATSQAFQMSNL